MICEVGDVVVVPFAFVERPVVKGRPALALSTSSFNADNGQTVMAMITTGAGSTWPSDVAITDRAAAGIAHRSVVRWKVFTLPNDLVSRRIGRLAASDLAAVRAGQAAVFGKLP